MCMQFNTMRDNILIRSVRSFEFFFLLLPTIIFIISGFPVGQTICLMRLRTRLSLTETNVDSSQTVLKTI